MLDWRTPGASTDYTPSAFRWAMATQYLIWALGLSQVYRYRQQARRVIDRRALEEEHPSTGMSSTGSGRGWATYATAMTNIDLGRPVQGDVVDLILDDHRRFEALLRDLRDSSQDRDAVRRAFATLHVAHAVAEETHVHPKLKRKNARRRRG